MHTLKFWGIICKAYRGIDRGHEAVNHSATQFVHDMEHTNGIESFWVVPKRAHKGVYHKFSVQHLQRYVANFAGRHNVRDMDTIGLEHIVAGMVGKRLTYRCLKAGNGCRAERGRDKSRESRQAGRCEDCAARLGSNDACGRRAYARAHP